MLVILYFVVTCNIANSYVSKLLKLLHYILPLSNQLKKTKHLFYSYFGQHLPHMTRYHACRKLVINSKNCNYCGENIDAHFLGQLPSKISLRALNFGTNANITESYFNIKQSYAPISIAGQHINLSECL
jgi:hypothetical protein